MSWVFFKLSRLRVIGDTVDFSSPISLDKLVTISVLGVITSTLFKVSGVRTVEHLFSSWELRVLTVETSSTVTVAVWLEG